MRSESSNYKLGHLDKDCLFWNLCWNQPTNQPRYRLHDGSWPNHKKSLFSLFLKPSLNDPCKLFANISFPILTFLHWKKTNLLQYHIRHTHHSYFSLKIDPIRKLHNFIGTKSHKFEYYFAAQSSRWGPGIYQVQCWNLLRFYQHKSSNKLVDF